MKIAILGWGSLLWDDQDKHKWFNDTIGDWQAGGPTLPIEFCRISSSRKGALTLVLQPPPIGCPCQVSFAVSKRTELAEAIADLEQRERCETTDIGQCIAGDATKGQGQFKNLVAVIQAWLDTIEPKIGAVIWTDLENNYAKRSKRGKAFTVSDALIHLRTDLSAEGRSKAAEYVWRAPDFVRTKLRKKLETWPSQVAARAKKKATAKRSRRKPVNRRSKR